MLRIIIEYINRFICTLMLFTIFIIIHHIFIVLYGYNKRNYDNISAIAGTYNYVIWKNVITLMVEIVKE